MISNVWVKHGDDLIHAGQVFGKGNATRLRDITIYDRSGGTLVAMIQRRRGPAQSATAGDCTKRPALRPGQRQGATPAKPGGRTRA